MFNITIAICALIATSFYSLHYTDTDGVNVPMTNFQGKKVLIVNIATNSTRVDQLRGLQQLQEQYYDSLVVIVFPSNSFGNESRSDEEIKQFCRTNYRSSFLIASKGSVSGSGIQPIFSWLADSTQNDVMNAPVINDFQKFLIDKNGNLVSVLSPKIKPTDSLMIDAITHNY